MRPGGGPGSRGCRRVRSGPGLRVQPGLPCRLTVTESVVPSHGRDSHCEIQVSNLKFRGPKVSGRRGRLRPGAGLPSESGDRSTVNDSDSDLVRDQLDLASPTRRSHWHVMVSGSARCWPVAAAAEVRSRAARIQVSRADSERGHGPTAASESDLTQVSARAAAARRLSRRRRPVVAVFTQRVIMSQPECHESPSPWHIPLTKFPRHRSSWRPG